MNLNGKTKIIKQRLKNRLKNKKTLIKKFKP